MDFAQFVVRNWYLFLALAVVATLLLLGPVSQLWNRIKSVSPSEAVLLINRQDGVVVDVREPKDFRNGHIVGALNLSLSELKDRARELEKFKHRPVIVSCRTGESAVKGAVLLRGLGFDNVCTLGGGMVAWERSQLPVAKS